MLARSPLVAGAVSRMAPNARDTALPSPESLLPLPTSLPLRGAALGAAAYTLLAGGLADLPRPGGGGTLSRWRSLASIAATDLALAKVLEAHYDASAICVELGAAGPRQGELWAVWAAEPPQAGVHYDGGLLDGTKAWCSGADVVTHALVTTHYADGRRGLAAVSMDAAGITRDDGRWQAVGMGAVRSGDVHFERTPARAVGAPGAYLGRPGFWHGGAGIAACWHGGAVAIADTLRASPRIASDPHAAAHLGAIDVALASTAALLRETADLIDAFPDAPHVHAVMRLRAAVVSSCTLVLDRVGRALGAGPLCQNAAHAQRCADLDVFLRQDNAERGLQAIGEAVADQPLSGWMP